MLRIRIRMSARVWKSNNRRTVQGTCPQCGAEGGKPQQQHLYGWKAEKSRVGWSLVGR
nr:MAG TPA: Pestivirus NS2 peptidase [Caudoviricetes sp.]